MTYTNKYILSMLHVKNMDVKWICNCKHLCIISRKFQWMIDNKVLIINLLLRSVKSNNDFREITTCDNIIPHQRIIASSWIVLAATDDSAKKFRC